MWHKRSIPLCTQGLCFAPSAIYKCDTHTHTWDHCRCRWHRKPITICWNRTNLTTTLWIPFAQCTHRRHRLRLDLWRTCMPALEQVCGCKFVRICLGWPSCRFLPETLCCSCVKGDCKGQLWRDRSIFANSTIGTWRYRWLFEWKVVTTKNSNSMRLSSYYFQRCHTFTPICRQSLIRYSLSCMCESTLASRLSNFFVWISASVSVLFLPVWFFLFGK